MYVENFFINYSEASSSDSEASPTDSNSFETSSEIASSTDALIDIQSELHNIYIIDFLLFSVVTLCLFKKMLHRVIYNHTKEY